MSNLVTKQQILKCWILGTIGVLGIASVSITSEVKIVTPLLHEIAMFLAPFEGASSYLVLWAWLLIPPENRWDLARNLHQWNPLDHVASHMTRIVHLHILTKEGKAAVFLRNCGLWSCVSGELEVGESWESAASREVREETGLLINDISLTNHFFIGVSPKGKRIVGRTCFAVVPNVHLRSSGFKFNDELQKGLIVPHSDALTLMRETGFAEALEGYLYIMKHHWIQGRRKE